MLNKKSNLVERRLYEYALNAVCSPLRVIEPGITSDQLAAHVAKLFNVDQCEHEHKYMRAVQTESCPVVLAVDIKKARDLPGEDQNGLSDPYCKVSVVPNSNNPDDSNGLILSSTPPISPSEIRRTSSLFSCASSPTTKKKLKSSTSSLGRRNNRRRSIDRLQSPDIQRSNRLSTVSFRTEIQPKTVNPEWNEHFEFEIENITEQSLVITVFDSDRSQVPGMNAVVQQKRGLLRKFHALRALVTTGQIEDDFLGQISLDIKSLATFNREQWFPLTGFNQNRSSNSKPRGEILLGLKIHFKLHEQINWLTDALYTRSSTSPKVISLLARHAFAFSE